jgi:hypothetical protein
VEELAPFHVFLKVEEEKKSMITLILSVSRFPYRQKRDAIAVMARAGSTKGSQNLTFSATCTRGVKNNIMSPRMLAAILLIAGLITIIYILSVIPYFFVSQPAASSAPMLQIIIPASSLLVIAAIAFLVPKRRLQGIQATEMAEHTSYDVTGHRYRIKSLRSGAIAGFGASVVLVWLVFAGDAIVGLPLGTFYSVAGIAMAGLPVGSATSVYLGIALHIVVGSGIGAIFGYLAEVIGPFNITGVGKGAGVGILAGFVSFSMLFIPLTVFGGVEASRTQIIASFYPANTAADVVQGRALDVISTVLAGAIVLHVVYGVIMGTSTALLLGFRPKEVRKGQEKKEKEAEKRHRSSETTAA